MSQPPDRDARTAIERSAATKVRHPGEALATRMVPELAGATSVPMHGVSDPEEALGPGMRLGQYELIRLLGQGGMGSVYVARDVMLGRRVAVKFLLESDPDLRARMMLEARATARCQHDNIVVIHEVGEHQGTPFLVLEYLEGKTLEAMVRKGPLPVPRVLELTIPIVRALAHAHATGLVHRDLKLENVFVTEQGRVKVLDFGIAKAVEDEDAEAPLIEVKVELEDGRLDTAPVPAMTPRPRMTKAGTAVGTLPYMSPEQLAGKEVDGRADIWAFGILIFELLTGNHPMGSAGMDRRKLDALFRDPKARMPSLARAMPAASKELVAVVDRCLAKQLDERWPDAQTLLAALEALVPDTHGKKLSEAECPYPGLKAFGEDAAERFFGRAADVRRAVARLEEEALVAVMGPSGAGKSSFVKAGVAPALTSTAQPWEIIGTRPARDALAGLIEIVRRLSDDPRSDAALGNWLRAEPGAFAQLLRDRVRRTRRKILLHVDQLEELYVLVAAPEDRAAYVNCLRAVADDPSTPLRVVVSMRSDFLDRAAEQPEFLAQLTRGMLFLAPLDRSGLREALVRPAQMAGYHFETGDLVEEMLDALELTPAALPLLQFAAARLWDGRDRDKHVLTRASYQAMGGLAGAIASHADQVVTDLGPGAQREVRSLFRRLITPDRTRAIVELRELTETSSDPQATLALVDKLVRARLLVTSGGADEPGATGTVEIVHESLIASWPLLGMWIEEEKELAAFLAQLRATARRWDERQRPAGLLWRNEALEEARRFRERLPAHELGARERAYLDAAFALEDRARRARRRALIGGFVLLSAIATAAVLALLWIRAAESEARRHAEDARDQAQRALAAQADATRQAELAHREQAGRQEAEKAKEKASAEVVAKDSDLRAANQRLEEEKAAALEAARRADESAARADEARKRAEAQKAAAEEARHDASVARDKADQLVKEKEAEVKRLEARLRTIQTTLK